MFDMGFMELALIAGIGLLVLGPERLPVVARTLGRYVGQARRFAGNFQRQMEQEVRLEELNKKIMDDTRGQSFRNNDGTTTHADGQVRPAATTDAASGGQPGDEPADQNAPQGGDPGHPTRQHEQP